MLQNCFTFCVFVLGTTMQAVGLLWSDARLSGRGMRRPLVKRAASIRKWVVSREGLFIALPFGELLYSGLMYSTLLLFDIVSGIT